MIQSKTFLCACLFTLCYLTQIKAQDLPAVHFKHGDIYMPVNLDKNSKAADFYMNNAHLAHHYRWVQFKQIPSENTKNQLEQSGIQFLEYVPKQCYLLAIPEQMDIQKLYKLGARSIQNLDLDTKTNPRILNGDIPEHALTSDGVLVKMLVMPGLVAADYLSELESLGALNLDFPAHEQFVFATLPQHTVNKIGNEPWVRYIDLMDPPGEPESVEGRTLQKSNLINNQLTGGLRYDAEGIKVLVRDDGDVGPHVDFHGRLFNMPGNSSSGTHGDGVAGVWAACGNLDPTVIAGASAADVYVIDYVSHFLNSTLPLHQDSGILITNSSYSNGCNDGYTSTTVTVDQQAYDNPTLLHMFSAGNSNNNDCGYGAGSQWGNITGGHKQGKNVIAVANLYRDGTLVNSSSRGPAHDGRIKPDLAGHGAGQISTNPNHQYQSFGGTSAASPSTAGNLTQLYDVYEDLFSNTAPAALIKACGMNSAQDLGNAGPDFKYGWGLIHTGWAYDILANNQFLEANMTNGGSNTHNITVPAGVGQLRVMLYWPDPEASVSANPALINDLDLIVQDPSNVNYSPLVLDHTPNPTLLDLPAVPGTDRLNNVEQVRFDNPSAGNYTVNVSGFAVPEGPQNYYIVWSFIPTGVQLTYPLGGERLIEGSLERIHWDAFGETGTFNVNYSLDNGSNWTIIASGLAADVRSVDWTVPNGVISGNCLVHVQRGAESDQSTENFSIHGVPTNITAVGAAIDSATVSWDAYPGATSYNVYVLGEKKMEFAGTTSNTSLTVGGISTSQLNWISVSANTLPAEGQRALAVTYEHDVTSVCGGCIYDYSLPYTENFENSLGDHCNFTNDDFDWAQDSGGTPSLETGPSSAQSGSGYVYAEASDPNYPAKVCVMGSPCLDLTSYSNANMTFYYHMYGLEMGTLAMEVSTDQGNSWSSPVWTTSGDQGDIWHLAAIDLTSYCGGQFAYRFVATTGTSFTSDMAIDNIGIQEGIVCIPPGTPMISGILENEATVSWKSSSSADSYDLEIVDLDASESFNGIPDFTGILDTSFILTNLNSLNAYEIYVRARCSSDSSLWTGPTAFNTIGCIPSFPWTEDLESYNACTTDSGPQECAIDGGWTQDDNDDNDWRINSGGTPSVDTGPLEDNTTGTSNGQYIYIESSNVFNLTSNLISPCIDLNPADSMELEFYFHMFGEDMGTLNVDISADGGSSWTNLWSQNGAVQTAHGDAWIPVIIDLSAYVGVHQIRFQGIAGSSWHSDMAIDDISIRANICTSASSVGISNINETDATVYWSANGAHDFVDLELVNVTQGEAFTGIPTNAGIIDTSFQLNGLMEATEYEVYLQANCGSGLSDWIGPYTFITDCSDYSGNNFTIPISINTFPFIDTNNTAIPCVTDDYNGSPGNDLIYKIVTDNDTDSLLLSTCHPISEFNTYIYLLDAAMNVLASNDDAASGACNYDLNGLNRFSVIRADVEANTEYYLVIDGFDANAKGKFGLGILELFPCNPALTINGTPESGYYSSSGIINSDAVIQSGKTVTFSGGGGVDLENNFEVQQGAIFEAKSDGCP